MDLFSYLLGKESGGGGSSTGLDWSVMGFTETPEYINNVYNQAKNMYDTWDDTINTLYNVYSSDTSLYIIPPLDCSSVASCQNAFQNCTNLLQVGALKLTSTNKTFRSMFSGCSNVEYIDCSQMDTSAITSFQSMFSGCHKIKELDLSNFVSTSATNISQMFNMTGIEKLDVRSFVFSTVSTTTNLFSSSFKTDCLIIVKDETEKTWITTNYPTFTNVKTPEEL